MSQSPPAGQGQCSNCHQFQPYTKQICDFCSARLPWAVQQTAPPVMTPPPLPRYPVQPPPQPRGGKNNTAIIIVGVAVLFFIIMPTIGVITLSILGNRIKNTFDTANATLVTTSASNQVSTASSADCGLMNTAECNWKQAVFAAVDAMDLPVPPKETHLQSVERRKSGLQAFKQRMDTLPPTPPRCLYALTQYKSGLDELGVGIDLEESAVINNNSSQIDEANDHYTKGKNFIDMGDTALTDVTKTVGPPG